MKKILMILLSAVIIIQSATLPIFAEENVISDFLVAADEKTITISWKNVDCSNVGRFEIFDENNTRIAGSSVNASSNVTLESGNKKLSLADNEWNRVVISGITDEKQHSYTLRITDKKGQKTEYTDSDALKKDERIKCWKIENSNNPYTRIDSSDYAYAGEKAVIIKSNSDEQNITKFIPELSGALEAGKEYRVELKAKSIDGAEVALGFGDSLKKYTISGNEWNTYSFDDIYNKGEFGFVFDKPENAVYLDDISISAIEFGMKSGLNLVKNGDFENKENSDDFEEYSDGKAADYPINPIAVGKGTSLSISWINPNREDIDSIEIIGEDGEKVSAEFNTNANAANTVGVSGLTAGNQYVYDIKLIYKNRSSCSAACISNVIGNDPQVKINGWKDTNTGTAYTRISRTDDAHSGNGAIKIQRNTGTISNNYQQFVPQWKNESFAYEEDKKYLVEFYYKAAGCPGGNGVRFVFKSDVNTEFSSFLSKGETEEWTKFSRVLDGEKLCSENPQNTIPRIFVTTAVRELYIDDFSMYEIDSENNKVGENLLADGDFDWQENAEIPSEVGNINASGGNERVKLTWDNTDKSYKYVYIYQKNKDENILRKIVKSEENSTEISGSAGESYIIKTVSEEGRFSNGTDVNLNSELYEIYGVKLIQNGVVTDKPAAGKITVSANVKNNSMGENFDFCMIVAAFCEDELVSVKKVQKNIKKGIGELAAASVNIPDGWNDNCRICVYFWNNIDKMTTLKDFVCFD